MNVEGGEEAKEEDEADEEKDVVDDDEFGEVGNGSIGFEQRRG